MKLRVTILPLLAFAIFGYSASVLDRATDRGALPITKSALVAEVKADLAKFHPSTVVVYNK